MKDIAEHAVADRVTYLELVVRPLTHCKKGLTPRQVIEELYAAAQLEKRIQISLVLCVSLNADDPVVVFEVLSDNIYYLLFALYVLYNQLKKFNLILID